MAYNEFLPVHAEHGSTHLTGLEWAYFGGGCPSGRTCLPQRNFDTEACYLIRTAARNEVDYEMGCLGGELTPSGPRGVPVMAGQAYVAVRTARVSPWNPRTLYFGGYDANFVPATGTAWVATAPVAATLEAAARQ